MSKLQYEKLLIDSICKQSNAPAVRNKYEALEHVRDSKWNIWKEVVATSAKKCHSEERQEKKNDKWNKEEAADNAKKWHTVHKTKQSHEK